MEKKVIEIAAELENLQIAPTYRNVTILADCQIKLMQLRKELEDMKRKPEEDNENGHDRDLD